MRIGIITQPLRDNYGGLLQNFALQQVLLENGHEPITLDWNGVKTPLWRIVASHIKWWLPRKLHLVQEPAYIPNKIEYSVIRQYTTRFINNYIKRSQLLQSSAEFRYEAKNRNLQALIVGSDQVWRPYYALGRIFDMYLDFARDLDVKKIAYAASFGTDQWEYTPEETKLCSLLAHDFDLVTTREDTGVTLCRQYLGVKATHVLDPTMLLDKCAYEKIVANNNTPISKGNLFHYILDTSKDKSQFIDAIAKKMGLTPFTAVPDYKGTELTCKLVKTEIDKCIYPEVEKWLRGFMDAEMVICDSFHGAVFSIIFNKPFWVIANKERGNARFNSLLSTFHLENRLITSDDNINVKAPIDWVQVNQILYEKRVSSLRLLLNVLK